MNLRDFIASRLFEETQNAQAAKREWTEDVAGEFINNEFSGPVWIFLTVHHPDRVLRDVAAARGVLDRHFYDGGKYDAMACRGCPTSEIDGGYTIDHIDECPELQDLAWRWHDHPEWDRKWCPHYETDQHEITSSADPRRVYMKTCHHCGNGLGRHYESRDEGA